jgi:dTDP-4-dehydrorhamnose reductase
VPGGEEGERVKRILVIGAKGMLGRDLVEVLRRSFAGKSPDCEILGWDLEEIDIREEAGTVSKIESVRPDIIVNLAAYTDVDGCETQMEKAHLVNAKGMKHVALGGKRCGAKVVYLSTDYVFDGKKREPYLEDDLPNPLSVYGYSKWVGERYLQSLVEDHLIIRTQWLYGRYGKNFVGSILRQAAEKKALSVVNDQVGSPTYTVDLSTAIASLIEHDSRGTFHVVNQGSTTWYGFAEAILECSEIGGVSLTPISTKELGRPAARPPYSVLNAEKLRKKTGMSLRPWGEALRDYLSTYRCEGTFSAGVL